MIFRSGMTRSVWVTKEGRRVPIVKMEDRHLTNALRIVDAAASELLKSGRTTKEVAAAINETIPCYALMKKEQERRGLK